MTVHQLTPIIPDEDDVVATDKLALAFLPLDKAAFGAAIGSACAVLIFGVTLAHVIGKPADAPNIWLLSYYFYGYEVSFKGAFIGAFWAFVAGFVAGWFVAFSRNLVIAISVFLTRARAELMATRDFLDHI